MPVRQNLVAPPRRRRVALVCLSLAAPSVGVVVTCLGVALACLSIGRATVAGDELLAPVDASDDADLLAPLDSSDLLAPSDPLESSDPLDSPDPLDSIAPPNDGERSGGHDPLLMDALRAEARRGSGGGQRTEGGGIDGGQDGSGRDPHEALWTEDCYPSAETCRECHPKQYEEWRASGHAYASVSPMFTRFEQAMTDLTEGTVGAFCMRCHSPVGTQLELPRAASVLDAPPVVREGVTCIACHRVREPYGRSNGDRRIEPGDIHAPVYGGRGGDGVAAAVADADRLKLKLSPVDTGPGQKMHRAGVFFEPLTNSDICVSCHQVAVHPGIWLEVVHAQYRAGPAAKKGISCQDCHMGAVPGKPEGYEFAHAAELSGKPYGEPRKHSNHMFWGPGYSIAHPGIFPHDPKLKQFSPREWLRFDYRAGWGTDEFERQVRDDMTFPAPWDNIDDRIDGRRIIDKNLNKLEEKRAAATMTLEAAIRVSGPTFKRPPRRGQPLEVRYRVDNRSEGHNAPTGSLGAQPQLWLNVVLIDPEGMRVWETGYLDSAGDLADMNSADVARGRVPRDRGLFNLQTKFLINNIRGTDREVPLPLNFSLDQLVFLRPGAVPVSVLNHPPLIRMEAHSIPPLDHRVAKYKIPAAAIRRSGAYRLSVRMRSRTEPPYFMREIGSTPEMIRRMNENMIDLQGSSHTFLVK